MHAIVAVASGKLSHDRARKSKYSNRNYQVVFDFLNALWAARVRFRIIHYVLYLRISITLLEDHRISSLIDVLV